MQPMERKNMKIVAPQPATSVRRVRSGRPSPRPAVKLPAGILAGAVVIGLGALLLLAACRTAPKPQKAVTGSRPASQYLSFTSDGAWCWFGDPRAIYYQGKVYGGWVSKDGGIWAGAYDPATGRIQRTCIQPNFQEDDHDAPSFLVRDDGRILVTYSRHGGPEMYLTVSRRPSDISAFEPAHVLKLNSIPANRRCYRGGSNSYTYPSLFYLSQTRTLYLFWRGLGFKPNFSWSTDGGKSWTPGRIYVYPKKRTYKNKRPYIKIATNGRDRLYFAFTDGHPRKEPQNSIYYACLYNGVFHKADGTPFCKLKDVPFDVRQADVVYDATKTGVKAWVLDVAADRQGRPGIVYVRFPSDTDHRYCYARWDGHRWVNHEIARGGGWFPQTPKGTTEREPNYSGGLVLDHDNPDIVYLSIPVNGVREIQKWTTHDLGATWTKVAVTASSQRDNVRPFAIRHAPAAGPHVLWMTLNHYTHYTDFDSEIKMDVPAAKP
ncbi:hypothetical protein BMS3Abin13_01513 [bacterium BMS3Abin13]|nr:hypothetical protein BMS3Abin13_01513 [bacterium BMS3Abin13]